MRHLLLIAVLLLPGFARSAPPSVEKTLPNGLTVIVVENHAQPLVTVEIGLKNGSMTEHPEYNGLSHLYEHMLFKAEQPRERQRNHGRAGALPDGLADLLRRLPRGAADPGPDPPRVGRRRAGVREEIPREHADGLSRRPVEGSRGQKAASLNDGGQNLDLGSGQSWKPLSAAPDVRYPEPAREH